VSDIRTVRSAIRLQTIGDSGRTASVWSDNDFTIQRQARGATPTITALQLPQFTAGATSVLVLGNMRQSRMALS
jgi:hypothetical protein